MHGRKRARNGSEALAREGLHATRFDGHPAVEGRKKRNAIPDPRHGRTGLPEIGVIDASRPARGSCVRSAAGRSRQRLRTGLGGRIRTCDPGHPKPVLYQTELRPDAARSIHEPVAADPIHCSRSVLRIARPDEVRCACVRAPCHSTLRFRRHDQIAHVNGEISLRRHPGL